MANKVSFSFVAVDKFSAIARNLNRKIQGVRKNVRGMSKETKQAAKDLRSVGGAAKSASLKMTALSAILVGLGIGAVAQSAKFEQLGVAFEVMTGSAEKGKRLLKELTKFSAETPFQLEEIAQSAKTLLAFGISTEDVTEEVRRLGDLAAGTGKPLSEFALIFGKIKAKGKVTGEELQQLAEKGINLREALGRKFNLTAIQVEKEISKGNITFEHTRDVIREMTSEGGAFFELMKKQSKTTAGLWSTLKDNVGLAAKEIGDVLVQQLDLKNVMAGVIAKVEAFTAGFKDFAKAHPTIVKTGLLILGLVAVIGPLLIAIGTLITFVATIKIALAALGVTFGAIALPVLGVVAAVGLLIAAGVMLMKNWREIKLFFTLLGGDIAEIVSGIKAAVSGMIATVQAKIEGIKTTVANFFSTGAIGATLEFLGLDVGGSKNQTDINVNLNAPKGVVKSVKTETSGDDAGLNLGMNMAEAL